METFGCCSSYIECSNTLKCLHIEDGEYEGCKYRRNLGAGRIFFGVNAGKVIGLPEQKPKEKKSQSTELYLACFREPFAIFSRHKNTLSYKLSEEQFNMLCELFDSQGIPFRTKIDPLDDIDGVIVEDDSPANSRVVFAVEGEEFHVLQFNSYLIKNYYAEKISKAFKAKGIESRVELIGIHYVVSRRKSTAPATKPQEKTQAARTTEPQRPKPTAYVQLSLFDMMNTAAV